MIKERIRTGLERLHQLGLLIGKNNGDEVDRWEATQRDALLMFVVSVSLYFTLY